MRKTREIVELGLLTALITVGLSTCSSSEKAGIILNVSTAPNVDRSAITALQVIVNGRTQSYAVGAVSTWNLGIETSAGSKSIAVSGMAASPVTDQWQGAVNAVAGQVVYQDVVLQAAGTTPLDGGGGPPEADGAASDGPSGTGGSPGIDAPVASGGVGGSAGTGGSSGFGGTTGVGGLPGTGAAQGNGGLPGSGGTPGTGGLPGTGGVARTGGVPGTGGITIGVGGTSGSGGRQASGGAPASGGTIATGGAGTGGVVASGGTVATGGTAATGGATGSGGTTSACPVAPPLTGTSHCSTGATGSVGIYQWTIWSSGNQGCLTTYANAGAAFSATWNNSGDFLAHVGLQWNATQTYAQLGTISADFAETRTGTGGGYSYIGIYGWSISPCVEYYIVEDSFNAMPVNPGSDTNNKGTADIDGGTYILYSRPMTGTGTSKCSGVSSWMQFYSVRKTARQCGQKSISQHFEAWKNAGMTLGKMDQATILVEVGGGSGSIDFTTASMTAQ